MFVLHRLTGMPRHAEGSRKRRRRMTQPMRSSVPCGRCSGAVVAQHGSYHVLRALLLCGVVLTLFAAPARSQGYGFGSTGGDLTQHPAYSLGQSHGFQAGLRAAASQSRGQGGGVPPGGGMGGYPGGGGYPNSGGGGGLGWMGDGMGGMGGGYPLGGGMGMMGGGNPMGGYGGVGESLPAGGYNTVPGMGGMGMGGTSSSPHHHLRDLQLLRQLQSRAFLPMPTTVFHVHDLRGSSHYGAMPRPGERGYSPQLRQMLQNPSIAERMEKQGALKNMLASSRTQTLRQQQTPVGSTGSGPDPTPTRVTEGSSEDELALETTSSAQTVVETTTPDDADTDQERMDKLAHDALHDKLSAERAPGTPGENLEWS